MSQEVKVSVKNLFKIFGPQPKKAMAMLEQGLDKEEIFEYDSVSELPLDRCKYLQLI